jgi:hypothetical protein
MRKPLKTRLAGRNVLDERQENALMNIQPGGVARIPEQQPYMVYQQPSLLGHYVQAIRDRTRLRIDQKTAQAVTSALRTETEQLKLANEYQTNLNARQLADLERDVRLAELEQKREDIAIARQQNRELFTLRLQRDRLALQVEIARHRKEIREGRQRPEPKLSPTQQRLSKKTEIEDLLQRLKDDETRALHSAHTELEKRRLQNMYSDRRDRLLEQLEKYL